RRIRGDRRAVHPAPLAGGGDEAADSALLLPLARPCVGADAGGAEHEGATGRVDELRVRRAHAGAAGAGGAPARSRDVGGMGGVAEAPRRASGQRQRAGARAAHLGSAVVRTCCSSCSFGFSKRQSNGRGKVMRRAMQRSTTLTLLACLLGATALSALSARGQTLATRPA